MTAMKSARTIRNFMSINFTFSSFPVSPDAMLNIHMKMILPLNCFGSHFCSFMNFLNLLKNAKCFESWESFPLEVHRFFMSAKTSKLIRSNNQSRATLWVLETCLIVGVLPFIIILTTAFVVAKRYTTKLPYEKKARLKKENQHCIEHQSVRGSYSARVPRSSLAKVHREFVHHIVENEVVFNT